VAGGGGVMMERPKCPEGMIERKLDNPLPNRDWYIENGLWRSREWTPERKAEAEAFRYKFVWEGKFL